MNKEPMSNRTLTITREFDASQVDVFNAFASADALNAWWGPAETANSVIKLDFRPGGIFHFKMEFNGHANYGRFLFRKIEPYDLLEFTNAFADENANPIKAPFDVTLPVEILYTFRFTEGNGKTTIVMTGKPFEGTTEEEEGFTALNESMQQGFAGTFDKLDEFLRRRP